MRFFYDRRQIGGSEIGTTCPAITPALGTERGADGDMEAAGIGNWLAVATPTTLEKSAAQPHSGNQSMHVVVDAQFEGFGTAEADRWASSATRWVQASIWLYANTRALLARAYDGAAFQNLTAAAGDSIGAAWAQKLGTYREAGGNPGYVQVMSGSGVADADYYADDMIVQPLTFSSMVAHLGRRSLVPGVYQCTPTVADYTQCGILIRYADASNFVLAMVDRMGADQAELWKCIAGTYTSVIAGNIVYGAAQVLRVVIAPNKTDYSLYYNGTQVGSTTAIANAGLGTEVYGFNSLAGNTVGQVQTTKGT